MDRRNDPWLQITMQIMQWLKYSIFYIKILIFRSHVRNANLQNISINNQHCLLLMFMSIYIVLLYNIYLSHSSWKYNFSLKKKKINASQLYFPMIRTKLVECILIYVPKMSIRYRYVHNSKLLIHFEDG